MSLKFRLLSFLSQNTLSRKHDVGILFTWAIFSLLCRFYHGNYKCHIDHDNVTPGAREVQVKGSTDPLNFEFGVKKDTSLMSNR